MEEPGLDGRHREGWWNPAEAQRHLEQEPLEARSQFPPNMTLRKMREKTGKVNEADMGRRKIEEIGPF